MKKIIRILNMERGFTLIEVIISLAIFSILSLSLMGIMINFSAQTGKPKGKLQLLKMHV